jgi:predicted ribonuclease YlaK
MASVNTFLDTMIYLHCVPLDQIDFRAVIGADAVTIQVPRVTFKELEKHKLSHSSARTRERARQVLALLEKHIESGAPLREGVFIAFIANMPHLDMEQYGLDRLWNDDVLIASALEFQMNNVSEPIVLITHDTGARLTSRQLGLKPLQLPEIPIARGAR